MDWSTPFPADVLDAMNKLLSAGASSDPFAAYVRAACVAFQARERAAADADAIIGGGPCADPLGEMFDAGFMAGAAEATRALSKSCADTLFPDCKVQGHG